MIPLRVARDRALPRRRPLAACCDTLAAAARGLVSRRDAQAHTRRGEPGLLFTGGIIYAMRDTPRLMPDERKTHVVRRDATVAETVSRGPAVGAAGLSARLNAAAISSGLAAIGSFVGGGMAVGAAMVIATPN